MKDEYDFSQGGRGKFYSPDAEFVIPISLDPDVTELREAGGDFVGQAGSGEPMTNTTSEQTAERELRWKIDELADGVRLRISPRNRRSSIVAILLAPFFFGLGGLPFGHKGFRSLDRGDGRPYIFCRTLLADSRRGCS